MKITRIRNGKEETFERKERTINYDTWLQIRIESSKKQKLIDLAKLQGTTYSRLVKQLINDYLEQKEV